MTNLFDQKQIRLVLPSQEAVPGQSINVALGQFGVNISQFLKEFNAESKNYPSGFLLSVNVFISFDSSFKINIKGVSVLFLLNCLLKHKSEIEKKDIALLLFFIRKFRKDLDIFSDFSICKFLLGSLKSRSNFKGAFKK